MSTEPTAYEKLVERVRIEVAPVTSEWSPTAFEMVAAALGYNPALDGIYLCRDGCGITWDGECDYGGWHTDAQLLRITEGPS